MGNLLCTEGATTFDLGTSIQGVVDNFTSAMGTVVDKGMGMVSGAVPYIIGFVAVGVITGIGIGLIKKFKKG